jgi:hypothetical protein
MMNKAYQYVLKEKDTVHIVKNAAGVVVCYYLLSQTQTTFKKISATLVSKYEAACHGAASPQAPEASGRRSSPSAPQCTRLR